MFIQFNENQFNNIFPFYIIVTPKLIIRAIGKSLEKIFPGTLNKSFFENYQIKRPAIHANRFESLVELNNQLVIIEFLDHKNSVLRGQFMILPESGDLLFIGSPWYNSMEQVIEAKLNLNDFALHDPMIDLLHVLKAQELTTNDLKHFVDKVNRQKNELKKAALDLQEISMFPKQNPDPLTRIDFDGKILVENPPAGQLTEFTYEEIKYSKTEFWHKVAGMLDFTRERQIIEAESGNKRFSFVIVPIPENKFYNIYGRNITQQKKDEIQLRLLSSIAAENTNGVVISDSEGKIEWVNKGYERITGYSLQEIKGKKPGKLLQGPDTNSETITYLSQQIHTGEAFSCEILNYHKSGKPYWVRIQGQALKDQDGKIIKYFAIEEDISAEKETRQKLIEFETRLREAFEMIGDNYWEYDFRTNKTYFSNPEILLAKNISLNQPDFNEIWWKMVHPDDLPLLIENDKKMRNGEIDHHLLEYRMVQDDGSVKWVLDRGVVIEKDIKGKPLKLVGTHSEITKHKNAEKAVQQKEEKYRNIIANMNLGLLEVDMDEKIQYANQRFCEMSGFSLDQLIDKVASDLFTNTTTREIVREKNVLRKRNISDSYEVSVFNKHGEKRWWMISGAPNYNNKGDLIGSIGIHLDITEQKRLGEDLIEAKNLAEASTKAKENFLANMSHEIRTPMNAIMGMSDQLAKTNLDSNQQFFLQTIQTASDNLINILNDILDLSKIEAGKLTIQNIGFEPKIVLNEVIKVMQYKAQEKGISLINSFCDTELAPVFIGDPFRLNQVLLNLVSNALKFTEKGEVSISCQVLKNQVDSQSILLTVKDTGIGMDEAFVSKIFDKFSQENVSKNRAGGTGLGMSITKQLIDLMGGIINIESRKGSGTIVSLIIELKKGSISDIQKTDVKKLSFDVLRNKKILIVDDNTHNRLIAKIIIKNRGAIIFEAENGEEALNLATTIDADLILMDIQMPVMNGYEATTELRKRGNKIPVIAVTANAIKGEKEKCIAAGMNDYISKPFREDDLLETIARWLTNGEKISDSPKTGDKDSIAENATPLYDLSDIKAISQNDDDFILQIVNLFCEQTPLFLAEMNTAYQNNDLYAMAAAAHKMKPSFDNLKIRYLPEIIREIETAGKANNNYPGLKDLLQKTEMITGQVIEKIKQEYL